MLPIDKNPKPKSSRPLLSKSPLHKPTTPLSSTSSTQSATVQSDLPVVSSPNKRKFKVTEFNPYAMPSPLLDPKYMEQRIKAFKPAQGSGN